MKNKIFSAFLISLLFSSISILQASSAKKDEDSLNQNMKKLSLNNTPTPATDEADEDSEDNENYQYQSPKLLQKLPIPHSFEQELKDINTQLALTEYPNFSEYTPFFIPFYRGIHYLQNLFPDSKSRNTHRHNTKAGDALFCSAAYTLCNKRFLDQDIDKSLLEKMLDL